MKNKTYKSLFIFLLLISPFSVAAQHQRGPAPDNGRILYHDGPVMGGVSNVYLIWYGDWSGNSATQILPELIATSGGSPYFRILTTYPDGSGRVPSGGHVFSGDMFDLNSQGTSLNDASIYEIIYQPIWNGVLPLDGRGIYIILMAPNVDVVSGFDPGRCEFHRKLEIVGATVPYIVVTNPARNPQACASQFVGPNGALLPTPNNNLGADAMANWMVHALNGVITNPTFTGWYDRNDLENSDKCRGQFGTTYLTANGARANINFAGRDYLIQQNWVNDRKGRCALGL